MNTRIKTEAAAYEYAQKYGAVRLEQIVVWADEKIAEIDVPETALFDISLAHSLSETISPLNALGGKMTTTPVRGKVFHHFHNSLLGSDPDFEQVSKGLYFMAVYDNFDLAGSNGKEMCGFWEDLDLANSGSHGDPAEIKSALLAFLKKNKT